MPDWKSELSELLEALAVSAEPASWSDGSVDSSEHDSIHPREHVPPLTPGRSSSEQAGRQHPTLRPGERSAFADIELGVVRREMEATVARVVHLERIGELDRSLRDDVVYVLQALTRPQPGPLASSDRHEWHLETAAAVLHFCRVVLRLTPPSSPRDPD